jgi:transcription termination factor Rho
VEAEALRADAGGPLVAPEPVEVDDAMAAAPGGRETDEVDGPEEVRAGLLDLLPNGSGFLRGQRFASSPDDAYVSPAQIRRCELRPGDEVEGPVRLPRRSERHPSLVRVDLVNGVPAEPPPERPRFEALTPVWASDRLAGPAGLDRAPFGRGSRVALSGPRTATTGELRVVVGALAEHHPQDMERIVVLVGALPEEVTDWRSAAIGEVAGGSFDEPPEELAHAAERALERARRVVERGRDVLLAVDGLDRLPAELAGRVFGSGRRAEEGGSLTVLATLVPGHPLEGHATTKIEVVPADDPSRWEIGPGSTALRADLLT